ncbi:MAG: type II secretion system protein M [Ectothiorhodospiraceae bacterium]|jgi:general secretion pathway protein M|nr:type II secretion system protein M [Ectothiorhodospiraceae bacterium]
MKAWLQSLSTREQAWVAVGALFLLLVLPYLLIWEPYVKQGEALERRVQQQRSDIAWMQAAAQEAKTLRAQTGATQTRDGQSLLGVVDRTAKLRGLGDAVRRVQPEAQGATVRVWLENARFNDLLLWIDGLEREQRVRVSSFVVDRLPTPGLVNARITLEGG